MNQFFTVLRHSLLLKLPITQRRKDGPPPEPKPEPVRGEGTRDNEAFSRKIDTVYGQYNKPTKVFQTRTTVKEDDVKTLKTKEDRVTIETKEKRDKDGNLTVTTIKTVVDANWKKKTKTTTEIIPANEVEEYRRQQAEES